MEELQGLMVDVKNTVVSHSLRGNKSGSVKYPSWFDNDNTYNNRSHHVYRRPR
jgi:hypothetical protein